MIYLDNAATSWPKPDCVTEAICDTIRNSGGNPGRGGHRLALAAGEILYETRDRIAVFFGCSDPFRVSFTQNITMAINLILSGFLHPGDHVLISPMEHNAVMRPLTAMGISYDILPGDPDGRISLSEIPELIRSSTKMIIVCHESNVNGIVQPLREIGQIAHSNGLFLLADCAQSSGHVNLNIEFGSRVDVDRIKPMIRGGTGSLSESFEQPDFLPDRFESGTQNVCGLAGLNAGIQWIEQQGIENLSRHSRHLVQALADGLREIPEVRCYSGEGQVLSVTIDGMDNGTAAMQLEERWGIMTRIGLHCAPLAHRTLGTFPHGTIRFAVSPFNTREEIETCLTACRSLAEESCQKK